MNKDLQEPENNPKNENPPESSQTAKKKKKKINWEKILRGLYLIFILIYFDVILYLYFNIWPLFEKTVREYNDIMLSFNKFEESTLEVWQAGIIALPSFVLLYLLVDFLFFYYLKGWKKFLAIFCSIAFIFWGTEAVMDYTYHLHPRMYQPTPITMWELAPDLKGYECRGLHCFYRLNTDTHGFRSYELKQKKPPGEYRIMLIGDSASFGWGVNDAETYMLKLERKLRIAYPEKNIRIINTAVPGWTTFHGMRFMNDRGWKFSPDLLIIAFNNDPSFDYIEDVRKMTNEKVFPIFKILYKSQIYRALRYFLKVQHIKLYGGEKLEHTKMVEHQESLKEYEKSLAHILDIANQKGIKVLVLSMPLPEEALFPHRDIMRKQALSRGFLFVDLLDEWKNTDKMGLFIDRMHPSPEGHKRIAGELFEFITQNVFTPK